MAVTKAAIRELLEAVDDEGRRTLEIAPLKKVPAGPPASWADILLHPEPTKRVWDVLWKPMAKKLPKTIKIFKKALQGIGLLTTKKRPPSLIYIITEEDGEDTYAYRGYPPVPVKHPAARHLPREFLEFYEMHNGWGFLWGGSVGPLPVEDWYPLSEDKNTPAGKFQVVFHNGGGAHLGFDLRKKPPTCHVVWSDDDPERVRDVWKRIDSWIAAQHDALDPAR